MAKLPDRSTPTPVAPPTPCVTRVPACGPVGGRVTHEIQQPSDFVKPSCGPTTGDAILDELSRRLVMGTDRPGDQTAPPGSSVARGKQSGYATREQRA